MSGIIRWLAPHMFPQLNTPAPANPVDAAANAAGNFAFSGAPGSLTAPPTSPLVNPNIDPNAALGMQPQQPTSFQHALQNAWQRYGGQGQWMHPPPQNLPTPQHAAAAANAILPRLSAPPPPDAALAQHALHPASVRVDFHPPPEPDPNNPLSSLYFLHPGVGGSGAANANAPAAGQRQTGIGPMP